MRFKQETIETLNQKGITVKWYTQDTLEQYKKAVEDERFEDYFNYYSFRASKSNPDDVKRARECAKRSAEWKCKPEEHTKLYVTYGEQGRTFTRTTTKSGEITVEMVEKWMATNNKSYDSIYGNFADHTQKLLRESDLKHTGFIYPTTYGIGIWIFLNRDFEKCKKWVEDLLDKKELDYNTEYSDARFVFRYKISKAKANIAKMNG